MAYTKAQLAKFDRLAREAAGTPQVKSLGELAREHAVSAVEQIKALATQCPLPEVRLKASQSLIELCKVDQDDSFQGDPEAIEALLLLPLERRRAAAFQLFANGSITRRDLDTALLVISGDQTAQLDAAIARNQQLEKALADQSGKLIEGKVNGALKPGLSALSTRQ